MPRRLLLSATLLACCLTAAAPAARGESQEFSGPVLATVKEVKDGDTLVVAARVWLGQVIETPVRMHGIDTPELRGDCEQEKQMAANARDLLESLVAAASREVVLRDIEHDKYGGRVLARVYTPKGVELAESMVKAGLARAYTGGKRQPWCPKPPQ